jgi:hypothetical protein
MDNIKQWVNWKKENKQAYFVLVNLTVLCGISLGLSLSAIIILIIKL